MVFMDEAGANLAMIRLYARSPRGQRAIGTRPQQRGQNVSMLQTLSLKGSIASITVFGSMDSLTFDAFIIQRVAPLLWPGACLIIDNSPTHHEKDKEIEKALAKVGARLIRLPPYSPDFSTIENYWSKVKDILKTIGARTYKALVEGINFACQQISLSDIHNWFTHCCYCTSPN
jgi:transposase